MFIFIEFANIFSGDVK